MGTGYGEDVIYCKYDMVPCCDCSCDPSPMDIYWEGLEAYEYGEEWDDDNDKYCDYYENEEDE
jgi:hypothetical protein